MRLLLDQMATVNPAHIATAEALRAQHEIVYWVRIRNIVPLDESHFPGTVFHEYNDALWNRFPQEVPAASFEPWGSTDILEYAACESEVMSMMDKAHANWPVDQRKDFYYELLRYWGGVIDTYSPDCIIFNAPPHQVFNFVLYAIAKKRGIKTILFDEHMTLKRVIPNTDFRAGNEGLMQLAAAGVALDELPRYLQDHYQKVSGTPDPTPEYLTDFKRATTPVKNLWRRLTSLAPHIRDGSIFERAARRIFRVTKPRLKNIYARLQRAPDFTASYVYMPLHYQPECTTSPQGGIYVDQLLMIKTLAAALPEGWELYVKEHPAQWPAHWGDFTPQRYAGFYEAIARIPKVRLVPMETNTFRLADHARATATASGTAAWESILRGKSALVFGYPWFMHAPGIFRVGSVAECRAAFAQIGDGFHPTQSEILRFLKRYDEVSFHGALSMAGDNRVSEDGLTEGQRMHRTIVAILQAN